MCRPWLRLYALLAGLVASGVLQVGGITIYTSGEVEAVNGTDVRLKCTFSSSSPIRASSVYVAWNFRPLGPGREESVFFYQDKPYPPTDGRFRKKATWAGDIMGGDASIMLREVKFTFNGTYSCQVKNPPDVHGIAGEVELKVVASASYSEIAILAGAVAGAIGVMMLIAGFILCVKRCHRARLEADPDQPPRERKDPTLCHPAEAVHLYVQSDVEIEIDSSDGELSEVSSNEPSDSDDEEDDSSGGEVEDDDD
ncbi:myelin protein zero-like protein 2 [Anguilla rostrata]|uniref:myelin protein zero-like protein 2 n=1 Tax=Anguilla rostrata TaxID=7938 RepID=UPI0030CDDADB